MSQVYQRLELLESEPLSEERGEESSAPVLEQVTEMGARIGRIESFIHQAGTLVSLEARRVDEIRQALKETVENFEEQLKEKAEILLQKETAIRQMDENLSARIRELENEIKDKEDRIRIKAAEIGELREGRAAIEFRAAGLEEELKEKAEMLRKKESTLQEFMEGMTVKLHEASSRAAEKEGMLETAVGEVRKLQDVKQGLEVQLRQKDEIIHRKDLARKGLEASLADKIRDLENRVNMIFRDAESKVAEEVFS